MESNKRDKKWELVNFCEFDKYAEQSYCLIHNVDKSLNLGDITKVDETKLEDFNMICGGSPCFVAGTKILTDSGYRNIEELQVNDLVYTKERRWKSIKRTGSDGEKEICSIIAMGILPIECTLNHPFWVKHKCKKWNSNLHKHEYYLSDVEKIHASELTSNDFIGIPIIADKNNKLSSVSDELLWLLGRYVADGVISNSKVTLSIGGKKISEFDKITAIHKTYKSTKSCYQVVFNKSSELYNLILAYDFGQGAINKNIPIEILELPKSRLKMFLDGYWSGDGCSIKDTTIRQAITISRRLAETLVLAIQKVYSTGCRIYFDKRPPKHEIEGRIVNQHDTYMVRFLTENQKSRFFVEDDFIWYPIRKIIKEGIKKVIYNIEVEDDHTYIANGAVVANCQDFSTSGKKKGSIWTCKDCGHEYNPLTVNYSQRDKCPKCGKQNIVKTRSSLLVEFLRVIREKKPNFGIYENVKNIVGKQFKDTTFKLFEDELDSYGYNSYYRVLNAKNYGIPQSRERVYLIFIKKELDNGQFKFPEGFDNGIRLKDVLEQQVDEKYYLSKDKVDRFLSAVKEDAAKNENKGNEIQQVGNIINNSEGEDEGWKNPQAGRVYSTEGCSPTLNTCSGGGHEPKIICCIDRSINKPRQVDYANCLTASGAGSTGLSNRQAEGTAVMEIRGVGLEQNNTAKHRSQIVLDKDRMDLENIRIRKFTPRECFRLMGFGDKCYEKVKGKMSNSQLYKQCGNSIVVDVLYYIFIELYKAMPYLFDDLKVSSYFSGIGAFEVGLDRLYDDINSGKLGELRELEEVGDNSNEGDDKTNRLIVLGNTVPSKHVAGRVFDTKGISPTLMENHGTVVQIAVDK